MIHFPASGEGRPVHAPIAEFDSRDGQLVIAGETVEELAARAGDRPFYAYDCGVIDRRVHELREHLPAGLQLHYAVKANPLPELVTHLSRRTDGLDVASAAELRIALASGIAPRSISLAGPGKSDEDLREAAGAGIIVNLESAAEMNRLAAIARDTGLRPPVALRVNPDFELKYSGLRMGGGATPFGIDAEQVPALLKQLPELPLEFVGFHIYAGGQNLNVQALLQTQQQTLELALRLAREAPQPVRWLNIGGGLGLPYFPGESPLDLAELGRGLAPLVERTREALPQAELVMELGRYLVGPAGVYICRVVDRKESRGQLFLVTNGGMHHHLAASGNFGQVLRKNYPVAIANRLQGQPLEQTSVVGPLCTPLDVLADRMPLPRARVGDYVAVFLSGAYGYSASPLGFLSHPAPAQLCLGGPGTRPASQ